MPRFKSMEEAQEKHKHYDIDTDQEMKYDMTNPYNPQKNRLDFIINAVPEGSFLLEVGCNSGGLLRVLASEKKCYCKGVDISEKMVERACDKGFPAVVAPAENLPFNQEIFDVVIMTEVMEHLYNPEVSILEIKRVLAHGGVFVGTVPHPKSLNAAKKTNEKHEWHCHTFSEKSLLDLLSKHFSKPYLETISFYNDLENNPQYIGWICKKEK
jgi:ubiquinone/menaquinone biosynthesis C-methylase UbiE